MKNKKITRKITQGVYALTTKGGGCIVDAVSQISAGENPLVAVSVMKTNYTNELLEKNDTFALSVLSIDVNPKIIETFGMNSMRDVDKFQVINTNLEEDLNIISNSIGYMIFEKVDSIENDTHTLFIGRLKEADVFNDREPLTYAHYQENKENYLKVKNDNNETCWICTVCGYIYYGEELPENFKCPKCGVDKTMFEKK